MKESKETSGGYLAGLEVSLLGRQIEILNQISFRKAKVSAKNVAIVSDLVPAYNVYLLDRKTLVAEKFEALMTRAKPRDFFDLYFILRSDTLRASLRYGEEKRLKILELLADQDKRSLESERASVSKTCEAKVLQSYLQLKSRLNQVLMPLLFGWC